MKLPRATTRALANKLMRDNGKLFRTYAAARSAVQYYRGQAGPKHRQKAKRSKALVDTAVEFPPTLPPSDAKPVAPYIFEWTGRGAIMSDLHVPYHDVDAISTAVSYCKENGHTDWLVILGDLLDCYQLSRWIKDPRERHFAGELDVAKRMFDYLGSHFGKIMYKFGNHELRYDLYMRVKAPELLDIPGMELADLLELEQRDIQYVAHNRVIRAAKLNLLHGHEYGQSTTNPVNPARGMFLRAKACTLSGHLHQTSQHTEQDIRRTNTTCWSLGCLCDLSPEYAVLNKWNHGFATMEFDGEWFEVDSKRIVNGRVA